MMYAVRRLFDLCLLVCLLNNSTVDAMYEKPDTSLSLGVQTSMINYVFDTLYIWKSMLHHPLEVSAFTASSPWVIKTIAEHMIIGNTLEIGAGAGTLSEPLAAYLQAYAERDGKKYRYDAVECLPDLYEALMERLNELPNAHAYCNFFDEKWQPSGIASSDNLYDTVISTIPLTRLSHESIVAILNKVLRVLKPGGKFIYVSLVGARTFSELTQALRSLIHCNSEIFEDFLREFSFVDEWLKERFDQRELVVYRNITPMRVYVATKK